MTRARRFGRLLRLLTVVVQRPGLSSIELAAELAVSERTLRRDLHELRRLNHAVRFTEGYELQGSLDLEAVASIPDGMLPVVYREQLRLLRERFPPDLARRVEAEVEAAGPSALAAVFERAIDTVSLRRGG